MANKPQVVLAICLGTLSMASHVAADDAPHVAITVEPLLLLFGGMQGNLELKGPDRYSFLLIGGVDKVVETDLGPSDPAAIGVVVVDMRSAARV